MNQFTDPEVEILKMLPLKISTLGLAIWFVYLEIVDMKIIISAITNPKVEIVCYRQNE